MEGTGTAVNHLTQTLMATDAAVGPWVAKRAGKFTETAKRKWHSTCLQVHTSDSSRGCRNVHIAMEGAREGGGVAFAASVKCHSGPPIHCPCTLREAHVDAERAVRNHVCRGRNVVH